MRNLMVGIAILAACHDEAQVTTAARAMNQYTAKFVCGTAGSVNINAVVAPGTYFTAINVHNPARDTAVTIYKKFAVGLPSETAGPVSQYFSATLGGDQTMVIDCTNIANHLNSSGGGFIEGFAVIESVHELDVDTVYTASSGTPLQVSSIHTVRSASRMLAACGPLSLDLSTGVANWRLLAAFSRPTFTFTQSTQIPFPGTSWIGPNDTGTSIVPAPSDYVYETCFCLCPGFQNLQLIVAGVKPDDALTLWVNGSQVSPEIPWPMATSAQIAAIDAAAKPFVGGKNCLRARVRDKVTGQTGFNLKASLVGVGASCQ